MATNDDPRQEARKYTLGALKGIILLVSLPLLWIAVAVNLLGLAERLSFLPGISREGGLVSGIATLVMVVTALAVIAGGIIAATGSGVPLIGGSTDGTTGPTTATPTQTATPITKPTPTASPTVTPRLTPTPEPMADHEAFKAAFRDRLNETMWKDTLTGVPVLATKYRETVNGKTELWLVYWECDNVDPLQNQRVNIGIEFANTLGNFHDYDPFRLRVYGVTNLKNYNDTITYINTSRAEAVFNEEINTSAYIEDWYERQHKPTQSESNIAYRMVVDERGKDFADKGFNQHHKEVSYCPGGASPGSG